MSVYVRDVLGAAPYDIHPIRTKSGALTQTIIAIDINGKFAVSCDVILHKHPGWHHEFKFGISVNPSGYNGCPQTFFSSQQAREYVPEDRRGDVGDIVCESVGILIGMVRPETIFRQLAEPGKPSLRLHDRISTTISHHGYVLEYQNIGKGELLHVRQH